MIKKKESGFRLFTKKIISVLLMMILLMVNFIGCGKKEEAPVLRNISFGHGDKTMVVVPGLSIGYVTDNAEAIEKSFAQFTDEYTVYLFDVRDDVPEDYTMEQMGEDLVGAIKNLGLKDIYMYGCSMGGMECIYVAGTYPELVKKVVVASSACKANETSDKVVGNWISLAKAGDNHALFEDMGQKIYSKAVYEASKDKFATMADGITNEALTRFVNTASAVKGMDLSKKAEAIKCPMLVLGSKGDMVLTPDASSQIAEITGAELYMYGEEYPHAVYDEVPNFKDKVLEFFNKDDNKNQ